MGERLVCNQEVDGSIPFTSTTFAARSSRDRKIRIRCRFGDIGRWLRCRRLFDIVKKLCSAANHQRLSAQHLQPSGWLDDWRLAELIALGLSLRMTVLRSSAEGHLVDALALRGDEGRSTLR